MWKREKIMVGDEPLPEFSVHFEDGNIMIEDGDVEVIIHENLHARLLEMLSRAVVQSHLAPESHLHQFGMEPGVSPPENRRD
jgi:hypothetical protein